MDATYGADSGQRRRLRPPPRRARRSDRRPPARPGGRRPGVAEVVACFPGEKAANGIAAGYDAVAANLDSPPPAARPASCSAARGLPDHRPDRRRALQAFFSFRSARTRPYPPARPIGDVGEGALRGSVFDGWGCAHLYRVAARGSSGVDSFAIKESLTTLASGFGDLSVREFAADPDENIAYAPSRRAACGCSGSGQKVCEQAGPVHRRRGQQLLGR